MSQLTDILNTEGLCAFPGLYTGAEIASNNQLVQPIFSSRVGERRAYVHPDEMVELGIFDKVLSAGLKEVLFAVMPDPVIYHCHLYEIAANDSRSHIFADSLLGWHRDRDSAYVEDEPTHVSIFVYLTDVGINDGAFEFVPGVPPSRWMRNGAPCVSVRGAAGYTFAWQRRFYHRASPNRGDIRRRLFKISIQRNAFYSAHLSNSHFQEVLKRVPAGDPRLDVLLGRYQGKEPPHFPPTTQPETTRILPTSKLSLSSVDLAKAELYEKMLGFKRKLRGGKEPVAAAYD